MRGIQKKNIPVVKNKQRLQDPALQPIEYRIKLVCLQEQTEQGSLLFSTIMGYFSNFKLRNTVACL